MCGPSKTSTQIGMVVGSLILCAAAAGIAHAKGLKSLALSEAENTCLKGDNQVDKVLAAADQAGWARLPAISGSIPNPNVRLKDVGEDQLVLRVRLTVKDTPSGTIRTFRCSIFDAGDGSTDLSEALESRFQRPATDSNSVSGGEIEANALLWAFVDEPNGRTFLPNSTPALLQHLSAGQGVVSFSSTRGGTADEKGTMFLYTESAIDLASSEAKH
jgi:hypothetical protein